MDMDEGQRDCNSGPSMIDGFIATSKNEILRQHIIEIKFLSVGCVIRVGCRDIAFSDIDEAMLQLKKYVDNPQESKKYWNEKF